VITIPRGHYDDVEAELKIARIIEAPISIGDEFGELRLSLGDELVYSAPLIALQGIDEAGIFARIGDFLYLFFNQLFD
ncbi:MAG: serine-type D-Ala-D-Ala carboxypeptidase, partial [Pseudomonadales bacterium]